MAGNLETCMLSAAASEADKGCGQHNSSMGWHATAQQALPLPLSLQGVLNVLEAVRAAGLESTVRFYQVGRT